MKKLGPYEYFTDFWNQIIWANYTLAMVVVIYHGMKLEIELNSLIQLCSIAICLNWMMLYYWLRLFPQLAFYVTMIYETLVDISWFMISFLMCVAAFTNATYVLNLMKTDSGEDSDLLWNTAFGVDFFDSFLNQYLVGLGEFNLDPYADSPAYILNYIYFILATLFTQIVFLNMLIAIMGETYGRVSEAHEKSEIMERTHLYADYLWAIKLTKELEGKRYLYVVKPINDDEQSQTELITKMTKSITAAINKSDAH